MVELSYSTKTCQRRCQPSESVAIVMQKPLTETSSERPQNERHNRIFRRVLGHRTPEDLFDEFPDQVYSIDKVYVA